MSNLAEAPEVATGVAVTQVDGPTLDGLDVDDLLLFLPADARPLRGVAGLLDWRLMGRLSQALADGILRASLGERVLWPAPRAMRMGRIFICGLGPSAALDKGTLARQASAATEAAQRAGGRRLALALPALGATASRRDALALEMAFVAATAPLFGKGVDWLLRG